MNFLLSILAVIFIYEISLTQCKDYKWENFGNEYTFNSELKTWNEAKLWCLDRQADLAVVHDRSQVDSLTSALYDVKLNEMYIGNVYKNGYWQTVKGQSVDETGYAEWQNSHGGNCGTLMKLGKLGSRSCNSRLSFACERKL